MPCRYVRDQLILIALNMVQLPNLEVHEAPGSVVQQDAFCIQWLQDVVDFWHHHVPFSSTVKKQALTCTANSDSLTLPSDFIIDVKNGLLAQSIPGNVNSYVRLRRMPLQKFINRQLASQGALNVNLPTFYCVVGNDGVTNTQYRIAELAPVPTIATQCYLRYYALPGVLEANQKPSLPSDYVAIEYLRIRALEWRGLYDPGTSKKFCDSLIAFAKSTGLMNEPEDDEIPLNNNVFRPGGSYNTYSWMGPV